MKTNLEKATQAAERFKARYGWEKVLVPRVWRPKPGDEILGFYGGRTLRNGQFGQYEVVIIVVPHKGAFTASGTGLINLIDAAQVAIGHPIHIRYLNKELIESTGKHFKVYELFVAVGEPIAPEDMPEVEPTQ